MTQAWARKPATGFSIRVKAGVSRKAIRLQYFAIRRGNEVSTINCNYWFSESGNLANGGVFLLGKSPDL